MPQLRSIGVKSQPYVIARNPLLQPFHPAFPRPPHYPTATRHDGSGLFAAAPAKLCHLFLYSRL